MLLWHSSLLNRLNLEARRPDVESYPQIVTERLQITGVRLVMDVLHPYVDRFDGETWVLDPGTFGQQFCQQERVLATRKSHEDTVIIFYQMISSHRLYKTLVQPLLQATALFIIINYQLSIINDFRASACPCSGQHDDRRP